MPLKRAREVIGTIFRFLFPFLLVLLAIGCTLAVIFSAVVFYRSSQEVAYRDVEAMAKPVANLKEIWGDKGELSTFQDELEKKRQEIQVAAADLGKADQRVVLSNLQMISANLSYLAEKLGHKRSKAEEAVADLESKVTALKNKVGPPAAPEKVVETLLRETGGCFLAILWPLVVAAIFFYLLRSKHAPEQLRAVLGGFKSLKLGWAEVVLNESERAKARTEDTFAALRDQAKLQYDLWVQRKSIRQRLEEVVDEVEKYYQSNNGKKLKRTYRCTLHVPDIVFADTLYQLLDYLPTGGGRGRVFSVRFGIIGKVWRRFQAETQGKVPTDPQELIEKWGMTPEEAKNAASGRPSFLCVPLKDQKEGQLGIFYMDSPEEEAFFIQGKTPDDLHDHIKQQCQDKALVEALAKMKDELSGRAPLIRVYER